MMTFIHALFAASLLLQCENFRSFGGWTLDPSSTSEMGSSYLMAHGYGVPVADAETAVTLSEGGTYAVWARTHNWAAEWTKEAPGRFRIIVDGSALEGELGTEGRAWHWQKAGTVALTAGVHTVCLHDLTGFNGRCDVIVLTNGDELKSAGDVEAWAARRPSAVVEGGTYDFIVCGGGIAGICAAQAAARYTAAKAGLSKFSHALYAELRPKGVRVFCVTPSWGRTDFNRACEIAGASEDPALAEKCIAPEDMGRLIVQLLETPDHLAVPDVTLQPMIQPIDSTGATGECLRQPRHKSPTSRP